MYSALSLNAGLYTYNDLVKLLAQNVTSFTKRYVPSDHVRIAKYLKTRATKYKSIFELATQGSKGKGPATNQAPKDWWKRSALMGVFGGSNT